MICNRCHWGRWVEIRKDFQSLHFPQWWHHFQGLCFDRSHVLSSSFSFLFSHPHFDTQIVAYYFMLINSVLSYHVSLSVYWWRGEDPRRICLLTWVVSCVRRRHESVHLSLPTCHVPPYACLFSVTRDEEEGKGLFCSKINGVSCGKRMKERERHENECTERIKKSEDVFRIFKRTQRMAKQRMDTSIYTCEKCVSDRE